MMLGGLQRVVIEKVINAMAQKADYDTQNMSYMQR